MVTIQNIEYKPIYLMKQEKRAETYQNLSGGLEAA